MCRVLVCYREKPRHQKDPGIYEGSRTMVGDPILVKPDGHVWGRQEGLPNYVSLDLGGTPVEEISQFTKHEKSQILTAVGHPFVIRKWAYNIQLHKLPQHIQDALRSDGKASITLAELRGRMLHKDTGLVR